MRGFLGININLTIIVRSRMFNVLHNSAFVVVLKIGRIWLTLIGNCGERS